MIIYLQDRRRKAADLLTKVQHVFGGFPLLFIGLKRITSGAPDWPMAILEIAIAGVVVITFLRELRQTLRHREQGHSSSWHAAIGWFDLAAGGLLIFEAFHQPHVKPGYLRPPFLSGMVTIVIGLFHGRLHAFYRRRRYLKLDASGLECRLGPFHRFSFSWAELKSVEISEKTAVFHRKEGRPWAIRLRAYNNRDEIRDAITRHARAAGVLASSLPQQATSGGQAGEPGSQPNSA